MGFSAEKIIHDEIRDQRNNLKNIRLYDNKADDVSLKQNNKIYNNWAQVKRTSALVRFYDDIRIGLNQRENDEDFIYSLTDFLDKVVSADFSSVNYENVYLTAVAIWILDALSMDDKLSDALKYLPDNIDDLRDIQMINFEHPSYDHYLIKGMIYLLKNRDSGLLAENGISCDIINQKNKNIVIKDLESEYPMRYKYESVIGLLNTARIENVLKKFNDDISEVLSMYYSFREEFFRGSYSDNNIMLTDNINNSGKNRNNETLKIKWNLYTDQLISGRPVSSVRDKADQRLRQCEEIEKFNVEDPYDTLFSVFYMFDNDMELPWLFNAMFFIVNHAISQLPYISLPYVKNERVMFKSKQSIYEKIYPKFSVFEYMDEEMDDQEYKEMMEDITNDLLGISLSFAREADEEDDEDEDYELDDEEREVGDEFYEESSENFSHKIYSYTGMIYPRVAKICDKNSYMDFIDKIEHDENLSKRELAQLLLHSLSNDEKFYLDTVTNEIYDYKDESENYDDLEESVEEYKKRLKEQKKQIDSLKHSLHSEIRKTSDISTKYEEQLKTERALIQELKDLREIVFNNAKENTETPEKDPDIEFPVKISDRRIISFGGFESWLNTIREYLPDVKFISPNVIPNVELIRNADEVWIQTNCMSHSFFYKIINTAKENSRIIRYYKYSSPKKCAQQIIMNQ